MAPTLEAVRDQIDPDDVFSERDVLALYLEQFPPAISRVIDCKVARNLHLRQHQDAEFARMEGNWPRRCAWITGSRSGSRPRWSERLTAADVLTVDQLLGFSRDRRS